VQDQREVSAPHLADDVGTLLRSGEKADVPITERLHPLANELRRQPLIARRIRARGRDELACEGDEIRLPGREEGENVSLRRDRRPPRSWGGGCPPPSTGAPGRRLATCAP